MYSKNKFIVSLITLFSLGYERELYGAKKPAVEPPPASILEEPGCKFVLGALTDAEFSEANRERLSLKLNDHAKMAFWKKVKARRLRSKSYYQANAQILECLMEGGEKLQLRSQYPHFEELLWGVLSEVTAATAKESPRLIALRTFRSAVKLGYESFAGRLLRELAPDQWFIPEEGELFRLDPSTAAEARWYREALNHFMSLLIQEEAEVLATQNKKCQIEMSYLLSPWTKSKLDFEGPFAETLKSWILENGASACYSFNRWISLYSPNSLERSPFYKLRFLAEIRKGVESQGILHQNIKSRSRAWVYGMPSLAPLSDIDIKIDGVDRIPMEIRDLANIYGMGPAKWHVPNEVKGLNLSQRLDFLILLEGLRNYQSFWVKNSHLEGATQELELLMETVKSLVHPLDHSPVYRHPFKFLDSFDWVNIRHLRHKLLAYWLAQEVAEAYSEDLDASFLLPIKEKGRELLKSFSSLEDLEAMLVEFYAGHQASNRILFEDPTYYVALVEESKAMAKSWTGSPAALALLSYGSWVEELQVAESRLKAQGLSTQSLANHSQAASFEALILRVHGPGGQYTEVNGDEKMRAKIYRFRRLNNVIEGICSPSELAQGELRGLKRKLEACNMVGDYIEGRTSPGPVH